MAREGLELVRKIYAAWERGDYSAREWADPEIELLTPGGLDPGPHIGIEAMARSWRGWLSAWEDFQTEAEEFIELPDGRVAVLTRFHGRGKGSGLAVDATRGRGASVFTISDGKVVRLALYADRPQALSDLGLENRGSRGGESGH